MKYSFYNDYSEGAHPAILEALAQNNTDQQAGYGKDDYCAEASDLIRERIGQPNADVHFVASGSLANIIGLNALFSKPYESVISAKSGHIHVHEAGALEATGHKINEVETTDGKLTPEAVRSVVAAHQDEHQVQPKVVYISQLTELGTAYTKAELEGLYTTAKELGLYFYIDGARLGSAVVSETSGATIEDIAQLCDMFYIGSTKNGALLGEAMVILHNDVKKDFRYHIKQRSGLLAKGRVMGVQFKALFTNDLYFDLARHANAMAAKLARGIQSAGYELLAQVDGNQVFPILPMDVVKRMETEYGFYVWFKVDDTHSAVRLVTSWATKEEMVDMFINDVRAFN